MRPAGSTTQASPVAGQEICPGSIGRSLLTAVSPIGNSLDVALAITHHSSLITHHSSLITHHSLLITHHFLDGIYCYLAIDAVAQALRSDCVIAHKCEVDDSALIGAHRIEAERHMRGPDFFGGLFG